MIFETTKGPDFNNTMKKKRLVFTLVGVSLLDEKKHLLGATRSAHDSNLSRIGNAQSIDAIIQNDTILNQCKTAALDALKSKSLRDDLASFSAEIASLYRLCALDNEDDRVILIASETPECAFSAIVNAKFVIDRRRTNNKGWNSITFEKTDGGSFCCDNVEIQIIEGLQVENAENFRTTGINNLFDFISRRMKEEWSNYHEVTFNITGGYKGTIPYLTLFAMLYQENRIDSNEIKVSIKYLYEESKGIITLPNLPVAYDLFTWRNYRGFIRNIPHLQPNVAKLFLEHILPAQISGLFQEVTDKYALTKFGKILEGKYNEEKEGELTPYGRGYLLVDKIRTEQKEKSLRDCINRWQYLWLGDLIPETVEHARGHTQRVLELLAQILYPILNKEANFLGDQNETGNNLVALIGATWLHDLGHSGDYLECVNEDGWIKDGEDIKRDIKGFPSVVREAHHLLSWYLIGKEKDELFKSENGNNQWRRDDNIFTNDMIEAIRQICLYHRMRMPVLKEPDSDDSEVRNCEPYEYIGVRIKYPLEKLSIGKVDVPLLGALLRVADGGDVQVERTISSNYEAMRSLQNIREMRRLEKEEKEFRVKVVDLFEMSSSSNSQLPGYLNDLLQHGCISEEGQNKLQGCVQKYICGDGLKNIDAPKKIILRNWLSALDQYVFKNSAAPHFEKHKGITAVMYLLDKIEDNNGKNEYHFEVLAIQRKSANIVKGDEEANFSKNADRVLEDISKEYKTVRKILNDHRIYFDSYHRMVEGSAEMLPVTFES